MWMNHINKLLMMDKIQHDNSPTKILHVKGDVDHVKLDNTGN